jgi:hypothetical protein
MKLGLAIEPGKAEGCIGLATHRLMQIGAFVAMSVRLATGAPIDIPFWFDVDGNEIKGYGDTLRKTYRIGEHRELHFLDDDKQLGLPALQAGFGGILKSYTQESSRNVLIRALEFAAIGFQTRHLQPRLVNNTIFLESIFSNSNAEIAFQIASSVSWYLEFDGDPERRVELFSETKKLYDYRSRIVHGSDISAKDDVLLKMLLFSENLNTRIFQKILTNDHNEIFRMGQDKRRNELRTLALGANCALIRPRRNA